MAATANSSKTAHKSSQTSIKRTMTSLSKTATVVRSHRRETIYLPFPTNTPHLSKKETKLLHDSHRSLCRRNLPQPWKWILRRMNIVKIAQRAPAWAIRAQWQSGLAKRSLSKAGLTHKIVRSEANNFQRKLAFARSRLTLRRTTLTKIPIECMCKRRLRCQTFMWSTMQRSSVESHSIAQCPSMTSWR